MKLGNRGYTRGSDPSFARKADASVYAGHRDRNGLRYDARPNRSRVTADEFIVLQTSGKLN